MANISAATSQKIKNMSIICALLVVTIHVPFPKTGLSWLYIQIVKDGIARIAVPYFFIISGFFLAKHFDEHGWYLQELRKRMSSLLVPFLIWMIITTCLTMLLSIIADIIAHRPFWSSPSFSFSNGQWIPTVGLDLRQGPASLGALWYVRCLLMFVVLSPLFKLFVKRLGVFWLTIAFALTLFHCSTEWPDLSDLHKVFGLGFSLSGVFYFSFGIWLRAHFDNIHVTQKRLLSCIVISALLLSLKTFFTYHQTPVPISLCTIAIPFMMLPAWMFIPSEKWPNWFTGCSFPLFLLHMPLIPYFSLPIKYSPLHDTWIGSTIVLIGCIVASIIITVTLQRYFPKLSQKLFAGRA